jgi:hypothetical protein
MICAADITGHIDLMLGLTPLQRWDAVTRYHGNSASNHWFMVIGLGILVILMLLLVSSMYRRKKDTQKQSANVFDEYAKTKKLSAPERETLMNMAVNAGLRRYESIFNLPSAFDRKAAEMIDTARTEKGIEESQHCEAELAVLRSKLDFHQYTAPDTIVTKQDSSPSTRQVPLKKKIYVISNHQENINDCEAVVIENTPAGLTVQFRTPVEIVFGKPWTCRYYSGEFVAEFDTIATKCSGQIVVLQHRNHVRLVNRRKFLRVPVLRPAYVAHFPFRKEPPMDFSQSRRKIVDAQNAPDRTEMHFELPLFVPATVTELGGPGLRINTRLSLNVGDRVLLMFKLEQKTRTSVSSNPSRNVEKIIEHIAIVRHVTRDDENPSIALELTGLNDDGIDELIRATNEASIEMNNRRINEHRSEVHPHPARKPVPA